MAPPCKSLTTAEPFSPEMEWPHDWSAGDGSQRDRGSLRIIVVNASSSAHACAARVSPHLGIKNPIQAAEVGRATETHIS